MYLNKQEEFLAKERILFMKNLTLENITKVCNGIYHGPQEKLQDRSDCHHNRQP